MITKNEKASLREALKDIMCFLLVVPPGIEPGTQGFSVLCSTN